MTINRQKHSYHDEIFEIDETWLNLESEEVGRREKRWIESPEENQGPFKKYHPYLLKFPKNALSSEIWSEVLASYIGGDLLGLDIQRAFIAKDLRSKPPRFGVLLESFLSQAYYGSISISNYSASENLVPGGEILRRRSPTYELKKGNQHSIKLIREATNIEDKRNARFNVLKSRFVKFWAETLAFDMLINNGDRHHDNWGMQPYKWQIRTPGQLRDELGRFSSNEDYYKFSTLYDHGGCLGSELDPKGLRRKYDHAGKDISIMTAAYAERGKPHMGYDKALSGETVRKTESYISLLQKFISDFPDSRKHIDRVASVDIASVAHVLQNLESLDIGVDDAHLRSPFVLELLKYRQSQLKSIF